MCSIYAAYLPSVHSRAFRSAAIRALPCRVFVVLALRIARGHAKAGSAASTPLVAPEAAPEAT